MNNSSIKFKIEFKLINNASLNHDIKKFKSLVGLQFNETSNSFEETTCKYMDVSNKSEDYINEKINNYFNTTSNNDSPYEFLILKNNKKLIILTKIHPSIFDYGLIKNIYEIFISQDYEIEINKDNNDYLNSKEFDKELKYWNKKLSDAMKDVKFYNIKSNSYKIKRVTLKSKSLNTFLTKNNISKFNFITGIFSLYLSRIDQTPGCLFNSINKYSSKTTLLKIDYDENISFNEHLNKIESVLNETKKYSKANIENYSDINSF